MGLGTPLIITDIPRTVPRTGTGFGYLRVRAQHGNCFVVEIEKSEQEAKEREEQARTLVKAVVHCDIH